MVIKNLESFINIAKKKPQKNIVVAAAEDEPVLSAIKAAVAEKLVKPILVGNTEKIREIADSINFDLSCSELIDEKNPAVASKLSVKLIKEEKAQILMKGHVNTADYLRAILEKDNGLRNGDLLSHIGCFEIPAYHKLLSITDAAQNIAPTLEEKAAIIKNSVGLFHRIGIKKPKIAVIAAVENVNPKMEASVHAALLTMMNKRNQIKDCIIDGPLAFDNAVSKEAAEHKGIVSDVAGDTDLIFCPDINVANALYKSFTYFAGGTVAAIILGASVPVVLTSRADSESSKLMSIALAAAY